MNDSLPMEKQSPQSWYGHFSRCTFLLAVVVGGGSFLPCASCDVDDDSAFRWCRSQVRCVKYDHLGSANKVGVRRQFMISAELISCLLSFPSRGSTAQRENLLSTVMDTTVLTRPSIGSKVTISNLL